MDVIILSHGSNPLGCKLPFYQVLKTKFEDKGYETILFDYTGFGEAPNPFIIDFAGSYHWKKDLIDEINKVRQIYKVNRLYLIGHSFGASPTLAVGVENPDVDKIVCISPPRRMKELMSGDLGWLQERMKEDMGLEKLPPKAILCDIHKDIIMEHFEGYKFEIPVLFIEGSDEPKEDLEFTRKLCDSMQGETHIVIKGNHYFDGQEDELVEVIHKWIGGGL